MWKRKCHFLKKLSRCAQLFSKNYQPITLKFCNYLDYRWLNRLTLSFFAYICWLFFQDFFHLLFFSIFENENTHINIYSLFIKKQKECHSKGLYEVELSWKFEANPSINGEETLRATTQFFVVNDIFFFAFFKVSKYEKNIYYTCI